MTSKNKWLTILGLGVVIALAIFLYLRSAGDAPEEAHAEAPQEDKAQRAEGGAAEGELLMTPEQIEAASIGLAEARAGSAAEIVVPATIEAPPSGSARVDARAGGIIRSIRQRLGDVVGRGETLATIESPEAASLAAGRASAAARLEQIRAAFTREKQLFEADVTARQDYEAAKADLGVAQAELERAEAAAAAAGVTGNGRLIAVSAPLAGRITAAAAVLGSYVAAGDELFRIVDPSELQVNVSLSTAAAGRIGPGDEASVALPSGGRAAARVRSVTPSLDPETRTAVAVLELSSAMDELQPGAFVQVRIRPSGETSAGGATVPEDAVQILGGEAHVFVRTKGGFTARPVVIGQRSGGGVAILSGLSPGDEVAAENAFLLKAESEKGETGDAH
ncbi:efflux RND transporter periplasmic adaptor subunit [Pacificimonas flava]|uniref:Cobalt/zinc/cadmium efflux RND transporter, membrane fusion protein, CzcB family n=1 Tax=Pacificimonas flava TaxID=1234595 RepID=M2U5R1_9SPHN|nr:efflux RND transporter periplasmic adaptor subunit [Pacificimonas flava]EMD83342.1 Cobalt/zinc/cadmium efflux RND transporter, membrane fusion protein, CzcB family [Pacificimonas flava]MBB5279099.1 cobalt-zinc-cadmium efflux system membrane fusion protein [Pacificimonas flava]